MKIGFTCDHAAAELKNELIDYVKDKGYETVNYGIEPGEKADYPLQGQKLGEAIINGEVDKGVFICGTGIGISLSANKIPGVRVAVCSDTYSAEMCVRHNNANGIAFGARVVGDELAKKIIDAFLNAEFEGGRHARRVDLITDIEKKYSSK